MRVGLEPTSSDYEPEKLPITLSRLKILKYSILETIKEGTRTLNAFIALHPKCNVFTNFTTLIINTYYWT